MVSKTRFYRISAGEQFKYVGKLCTKIDDSTAKINKTKEKFVIWPTIIVSFLTPLSDEEFEEKFPLEYV